MRFRTVIKQAKQTATGIVVPPEVVESFGAGKKPAVAVTINGYTYRSSIAVMGGVYMVGVSAETRKAANVAGGDEVDVDIVLDTAPREVEIPADLKKALAGNKQAKKFFETLSYSNKRRHTLSIEDAKTPETRQKRIDKAIAMLEEGKK